MSEYNKILSRAAKLCSTGERCEYDIKVKMVQWGIEPADIEKSIKYLVENNFLDDTRYAHFFTKDKLKFNKWGRVKIIYALRQKQISSEIIENAIQSIDYQEYIDLLDQIIGTKINLVGTMKTASNKAKILRFAAQKGFTSEEIYGSINRIEKLKEEF